MGIGFQLLSFDRSLKIYRLFWTLPSNQRAQPSKQTLIGLNPCSELDDTSPFFFSKISLSLFLFLDGELEIKIGYNFIGIKESFFIFRFSK